MRLRGVSASKPSLALNHLQGYIEEHCIAIVAPSSNIGNWGSQPYPLRTALIDRQLFNLNLEQQSF